MKRFMFWVYGVVVCCLIMVVEIDLDWFNWDWVGDVWVWVNGIDLN